MLWPCLIRHNVTPFSSRSSVVSSQEGWQLTFLCRDYRVLNSITVMDRLMDEFHVAVIFSKLDLRAGYHQIRVVDDDICNITFRTHHGHYEFTVMHFGLSNAPTTFQCTMN